MLVLFCSTSGLKIVEFYEQIKNLQQQKLLKQQKLEKLLLDADKLLNSAKHKPNKNKHYICRSCYHFYKLYINLVPLDLSEDAYRIIGNMKCPNCKQDVTVE